ncbi:thymidine phosphorylase [Echinimonas agarilytica]|uniref:Thymidine phosphorylase n=1 Tax=Echinimonas agarilytica TaxID=1215918 RepID=A0AA42B7F5_9GAMM|nr:thymidine phosphorylase [Echinimonas agarilytica]MCM2679556.1 thymidine phosphorylase [Echinimonas agarilytica]
MWLAQEVIRQKRDGSALAESDILRFVQGITDESVSEGQIAAMAMAIYLNGMNLSERTKLTKALRDSGSVMEWMVDGPVVDKHSSGGVGDFVSLVLGPILAACGCYVPMISGRGLGHTGGTLDKFDSIAGYNTHPDLGTFRRVVKECGVAIVGQTAELAPADGRLYSIRDVTGTVESVDLITASILAKKLAEGLDVLVMDVKVGNGAFMQSIDEGLKLATSIVNVANNAGTNTTALITDMSQPLARTAGNALEMKEAIALLKGEVRSQRLWTVTLELAKTGLCAAGLATSDADAEAKVMHAWKSGKAAEHFEKMVSELGGPSHILTSYEQHMPKAMITKPVLALRDGYVYSTQTRDIGLELIPLGGARKVPSDDINHAVGLSDLKFPGEYVSKGQPLAVIHAESEEVANQVSINLQNAYHLSTQAPEENILIHRVIPASSEPGSSS